MHCPRCAFDNPTEIKYCGRCGTRLGNQCPQCGFESPPGFKFCRGCGTLLSGQAKAAGDDAQLTRPSQTPASYTPKHLAERILAEQEALQARSGTEGERKLSEGYFQFKGLGAAKIKGVSERKPKSSSPRSTAGSPRDLIPPT